MPTADLPPRVLVVEDDALVAEDLRQTLEESGFEVTDVARSAVDALESAGREVPDLALLDVRLPGELDGIDAGTILGLLMGVPVVYLSAFSDRDTLERAKRSNPYGYLVKPFHPRALRTTLEVALHRHGEETEARQGENRFRASLDAMVDSVIVADAEGRVRYVNPSAEGLLAQPASDLVGRRTSEVVRLVNEVSGRFLPDPFVTALSDGVPVYLTGHNAVVGPTGRRRPVVGNVVPTTGEPGSGRSAVMVLRDPRIGPANGLGPEVEA